MPVEVIMPKVDMDMDRGRIAAWHVAEGDTVARGDPLFDIETDKAAMEVEAPGDGTLHHVTAGVGDEVAIGQAVAWIYAEGEAVDAAPAAAQGGGQAEAGTDGTQTAPEPGNAGTAPEQDGTQTAPEQGDTGTAPGPGDTGTAPGPGDPGKRPVAPGPRQDRRPPRPHRPPGPRTRLHRAPQPPRPAPGRPRPRRPPAPHPPPGRRVRPPTGRAPRPRRERWRRGRACRWRMCGAPARAGGSRNPISPRR